MKLYVKVTKVAANVQSENPSGMLSQHLGETLTTEASAYWI